MNLQAQINLITAPQEFARLCNAVLASRYGEDYLPVDDDRPDRGNDGYLKSERRMFAMHCFKRAQNQSLDAEIRKKMVGDLRKAVALRDEGRWVIEAWTFVSNYPVTEDVGAEVLAVGVEAGVDVSWLGPDDLADALQRDAPLRAQFPALQVNEVMERVDSLHHEVGKLKGVLSASHMREPTEDEVAVLLEGVPVTDHGQRALIEVRPGGWEYILFASYLKQGMEALELRFREHETRVPSHPRIHVPDEDVFAFLGRKMRALRGEIEVMMRVFDADTQERAFGAQGELGDPIRIEHFARRILAAYEHAMDWAAELRGVEIDSLFEPLLELTARFADPPVRQIRQFIDGFVAKAEAIPRYVAKEDPNKPALVIEMNLLVAIDDEVSDALSNEMERVGKLLGDR